MIAVIQAAHLCFAATVTEDGRPNVSPKGTIGVWDATHLFFLDLASPHTRANLARQPWLELNVVEQLSRRGYRFSGPATVYPPDTPQYDDGVRRIYRDGPPPSAPSSVVILSVERAGPLLSPAYWRGLDETAIRAQWSVRRAALDAEFEAYLAQVEPVRLRE
jgi:hypothetical protein